MNQQDYLFELGCEELPPMALKKMENSLRESIATGLTQQQVNFENIESFATPRRLAVIVRKLEQTQPDKVSERLGPAVAAAFDEQGKPKPAALGFARSCGVEVDQLQRKDTDKGQRLAFQLAEKGKPITELVPGIIEKAINALPVPKAMRWGNNSFQFSRPVQWLLSIYGNDVLPLNLFGLEASNMTFGHRFHAPEAITIKSPADYENQLLEAHVVADREKRSARITEQVRDLAASLSAQSEIDPALLEEVCALVEWPVALLGQFDEEFLQVPAEALISSMAEHQKYFHLRDSKGKLLPNFIAVSNIESKDPQSVVTGNEKVIRPRLADAKFFYDNDSKRSLESRIAGTKTVLFQKQLGSVFDKSLRLQKLGETMAKALSLDTGKITRAAALSKCDLMTDMVYEFTDLQGIMGRYYAANDGEDAEVAAALDEVYWPKFAGDRLPDTQTGTLLALAERLDTLVGIFGIGQIPTGAKDPYGLRRAALGIIRLLIEKQIDFDFDWLVDIALQAYDGKNLAASTKSQVLDYLAARINAYYLEQGISAQSIQAVSALSVTTPLDFDCRVRAVNEFAKREEAADLAQANKRVANILAKSDTAELGKEPDEALFGDEEKALYAAIKQTRQQIEPWLSTRDYQKALDTLAELKPVVNAFFDSVMINAEEENLRHNRFSLIQQLRNLFLLIADVSLLQK